VIVFAKVPEPGAVKTRLIPLLGAEGAAALHAKLTLHTLAIVKDSALGSVELHGTSTADPFLAQCAARYQATLRSQCPGDLGARMLHAFASALESGRPAILIGTDCPSMTAPHLQQAARALEHGYDAVFTPTEDGGYALIGLNRCDPRLFSEISWSSPQVMNQTRARLRDLDWRWTELETLWDVDRPGDYERLTASGLFALSERPEP
jgi:rSAM/selenodomain-associated transferase 1